MSYMSELDIQRQNDLDDLMTEQFDPGRVTLGFKRDHTTGHIAPDVQVVYYKNQEITQVGRWPNGWSETIDGRRYPTSTEAARHAIESRFSEQSS